MKFSEQWLREWVNPSITTEVLADQLTMAGLEVDAIEPVAADFDKVVVGEVIELNPHPDADKLRVCKVNVGDKAPLSIVCGAANVVVGMKVPTALIGATLPGIKIKKSKLRGVESFGMLCSAKEIGLAESAEGLLPLEADAPVGQSVREYLKLDDVSIELGITPNRGDCLGMAGIAREVGVLNRLDVTGPKINPVKATHKTELTVTLTADDDCPQYCGRVIKGINPKAVTPMWMQEKLRRAGLRSLSPTVDVTNYVLLELGQPMHAFDLAKIDKAIEVRHAKKGESLELLDGQTIELTPGSLVIADKSKSLALAGIMGGELSAVQDDTTDIFLESAYFNPLSIAGKARSYGLHTDSSHRFERGVSPDLQVTAIERATRLLLDIVGGEPGPVTKKSVSKKLPKPTPISLREPRVERVLGTRLQTKDIEDILTRLGMRIEANKQGWKVTAPVFRFDMEIEEDLIEELARIYGYNNLPLDRPSAPLMLQPLPETVVSLRRVGQLLSNLGYQESITYSFVDKQIQDIIEPDKEAVALANPISSDMAVMRTSLWPGLIQVAQFNLHRQQNRLFLFECGLKFVQQGSDLNQEMTLAGLLSGERMLPSWDQVSVAVDYYDLKGHLESLFELSACSTSFKFVPDAHPALHPGQSARIYRDNQAIGWAGLIHPKVAKQLDLDHTMYLFELKADSLQKGRLPEFEAVSKFPMIRRDISIVVDQAVTADNVRETINKAAPETLKKIELFDMYMGEGIDSGRKSLSLGLILQDISRTLTDSEIEQVMQRVIEQLRGDLGATLRQ